MGWNSTPLVATPNCAATRRALFKKNLPAISCQNGHRVARHLRSAGKWITYSILGETYVMSHPRPATVGQLKETSYSPCGVKDELRRNVIRKLKSGEELFP